MIKNTIFLISIGLVTLVYGQNQSELRIEQIMQGNEFIGHSPENIFWSEDSKHIYFDWNPENQPVATLYKYSLVTQKIDKVNLEEEKKLPNVFQYDYNTNRTKKVYAKNGDIYQYDAATDTSEILVNTFNEREYNPKYTKNGAILFTKKSNLYLLKNGQLQQLTNFKRGKPSKDGKTGKQEKWLEDQQLVLFDVLKKRKKKEDFTDKRDALLEIKEPKSVHYGDKRISNITLSRDENFVTYKLSQFANNERVKIPHYVNESGYTTIQNTNAKVGGKDSHYELWILDRKRDTTYQVTHKSLSRIYDKPKYLAEYQTENFNPKYDTPRKVNYFGPFYNKRGDHAIIEIRALDNKDRWYAKLDLTNGSLTELDNQHDDAWVAGPGIPWWNSSAGDSGWLDNQHFWFHSEKTGFSHLYKINVQTGQTKALTQGKWEVHNAQLSQDRQNLYITTNEEHPGERHLYRLDLKTLRKEKLTKATGNHDITISPDEKYIADLFSFSNKPWEIYLQELHTESTAKQITRSTTKDFDLYAWRVPELVKFNASDGKKVTARLYKAKGGTQGKPAVIFVHGAGYLQNAHKWWSGYYREYMFHNFLADNGYTVLDIDYRASKGYGRDWRTGIYRHMGGKDLSDQVDGANYLVEKLGVDENNIGIYGGSYGGFITLMALFNAPETFKSGAAIRSVTDWAHYNHAYTSNILNTPTLDPKAYQKSSPINFAEGLQGNLLILHGMVDDNVHMQDVIRLSQRLIELKKENWEMALYPVERHGFVEPSSWTDEYKRIFKLFEETLKK